MKILRFLYYNYYLLSKLLKGKDHNDSAHLYLSLLLFVIFLPWLTTVWHKLFGIKWPYFILLLLLLFVCYKLVKKYIAYPEFSINAFKEYADQTRTKKIFGVILVVLLPIIIPVLEFWIIKLLK